MGFQPAITIHQAIKDISDKKYLLPAIQREFVWESEKIERLFDSIMRGYPIGSFLFWHVEKSGARAFQFYDFIRNFHQRDHSHNERADVDGTQDLTAVLDGQQRLTALYIGLKGSLAEKTKWRRRDSDDAYPKRVLHLRLDGPAENSDLEFDFRFLSQEEVAEDTAHHWFPVGKVLDLRKPQEVHAYLRTAKLADNEFAAHLFELREYILERELINSFLERDQELDKVLNIFIRVNSGGTPLSYSDLLLSIATAQWKERDARTEIHALVDSLNELGPDEGFSFDKDFVLKASLVLSDFQDIKFKVDNFNAENMRKIEVAWPQIQSALRMAVALIASFGFSSRTLTSNNAIIPVAYYLLRRNLPDKFVEGQAFAADRRVIRRWLTLTLLKGTFGSMADTVMASLRTVIRETQTPGFPIEAIASELTHINRALFFAPEEVDALLENQYGQKQTFAVLALLYPSLDYRNRFHQDHIFPASWAHKKKLRKLGLSEPQVEYYIAHVNDLANLQMLEGTPNQEKSDALFKDWFDGAYKSASDKNAYRERHSIPDTSLEVGDFEEFSKQRRDLLRTRLRDLLLSGGASSPTP